MGPTGDMGTTPEPSESITTRVYTIWGVNFCPASTGSQTVYSGRAGTAYHDNSGSGSNILCLDETFDIATYTPIFYSTTFGSVFGVEYRTVADDPIGPDFNGRNVPCAVCTVQTNAVLMIPGANDCPAEWTLEYRGFVMSEWSEVVDMSRISDNFRSEYICVVDNPSIIASVTSAITEARLAHVHVDCRPPASGGTSGLECDGVYDQGQLSCVVCQRQ